MAEPASFRPVAWRPLTAAVALVVASCTSSGEPSTSSAAATEERVILLGRIVTMDDRPMAEAIAFEDGVVLAVGSRDDVMALAEDGTRVIDLGMNVAYPGFIDAHAHWIGDREVMGLGTPADAMDAAVSRGWTSIAELWVDEGRRNELQDLAEADALRLRVDGYLALNLPAPSGEHLGDWYTAFEPGIDTASDRLRIGGVKVTLDNGWGTQFWWEPADLLATIRGADEAGWQVAVHTVSTEAHEMVLDAFEDALAGGPNTLHHRIDHAIQVTDEQLARMVALDLVTIIHLDGTSSDWVLEADYLGNLGENTEWLARWRDFVDAGLHVAAASDAPWTFPDFALVEEIGRPMDQIAGGMDGMGRANPDTPAWALAQTLTAEQGLAAVTRGAAYALGDETHRGHLASGAYADITILSGDVTDATADEIRQMRVVATIVGGETEYCADAAMCP